MAVFNHHEKGFTLVEVMVSLVVSMTVLAGMVLMFSSQNNHYNYQDKRIDTVQDLELGIKFIGQDLRSALVGGEVITITQYAAAPFKTKLLTFVVWDKGAGGVATVDRRLREYAYQKASKQLKYDRVAPGGTPQRFLDNVTFFKVFNDSDVNYDQPAERSGVYSGMPNALPPVQISAPGGKFTVDGYTILIEMEVKASVKGASPVDVMGNPVKTQRVWRYTQVYPLTAVN